MVLFLLPLACVASSYHTNKSPSKLNWELRINSDKETFHRERDKDREWECVFKHAYSLSVYPDSKKNQSHLSGQMIFYSERPRNETTFWTCRFNKTKSHNHIYLLKSVSLLKGISVATGNCCSFSSPLEYPVGAGIQIFYNSSSLTFRPTLTLITVFLFTTELSMTSHCRHIMWSVFHSVTTTEISNSIWWWGCVS